MTRILNFDCFVSCKKETTALKKAFDNLKKHEIYGNIDDWETWQDGFAELLECGITKEYLSHDCGYCWSLEQVDEN